VTGTVTIYVKAGTLADDNGRIFPAVDTAIGTYAYSPSTTSGSSALPGTPAAKQPSSLTRQAVSQQQTTEASPLTFVLAVLSALVVAGCLLVLPRRR
jgi:hypothetical protein